MKLSLLALLLLPVSLLAGQLPEGITLAINMKGATDHRLVIDPKEPVTMVLAFSNVSVVPIRLRIHDYDPFHKKLPYPVDCAVRITDSSGSLHPAAKMNGEWWSQYLCWSTVFREDDEHNYRLLKPGEALAYEVALADVLKVPAGGEPREWPYDSEKGFKPGDYRFRFRYGSVESPIFDLRVDGEGKKADRTSRR